VIRCCTDADEPTLQVDICTPQLGQLSVPERTPGGELHRHPPPLGHPLDLTGRSRRAASAPCTCHAVRRVAGVASWTPNPATVGSAAKVACNPSSPLLLPKAGHWPSFAAPWIGSPIQRVGSTICAMRARPGAPASSARSLASSRVHDQMPERLDCGHVADPEWSIGLHHDAI
jgi:hypothetical protein